MAAVPGLQFDPVPEGEAAPSVSGSPMECTILVDYGNLLTPTVLQCAPDRTPAPFQARRKSQQRPRPASRSAASQQPRAHSPQPAAAAPSS